MDNKKNKDNCEMYSPYPKLDEKKYNYLIRKFRKKEKKYYNRLKREKIDLDDYRIEITNLIEELNLGRYVMLDNCSISIFRFDNSLICNKDLNQFCVKGDYGLYSDCYEKNKEKEITDERIAGKPFKRG